MVKIAAKDEVMNWWEAGDCRVPLGVSMEVM